MSGFVGRLFLDPRSQRELSVPSRLLKPLGALVAEIDEEQLVAVVVDAHGSEGHPAALFVDDDLIVFFDGRLDEVPGGADGRSTPSTDAHRIANLWKAQGERCVDGLVGDYALVVYERARRCLWLTRDAVGIRPLHVIRTGASLCFGSRIDAVTSLAAKELRPNLDVLAEHLLGGAPRTGELDTFYESVESIPPGVLVRFDHRGAVRRRVWDFEPADQIRLDTYGEYVDCYRERFQTAVRRRMRPDGCAVLVSGGLDSSSILAVARREFDQVRGYAFSYPASHPADESMYRRILEGEERIEEMPIRLADDPETLRKLVSATESPVRLLGYGSMLSLADRFHRAGISAYLTGHWGDQALMSRGYLVDLLAAGKLGELMSHIARRSADPTDVDLAHVLASLGSDALRWHLPAPLGRSAQRLRWTVADPYLDQPWFSSGFRGRARARPRRFQGGRGAGTVHARSLYARIRSPYYAAGTEAHVKAAAFAGLDVSFPFLDRDLLAFLMATPGQMVSPGGVSRGVHRDAMAGLLPEEVRLRRDKSDGTLAVNEGVAASARKALGYFRRGCRCTKLGILDADVFERAVGSLGSWRTDSAVTARAVVDTILAELWLRTCVEGVPDG
jgi:asparagine synthase (glutamine-hydrolysing)